MWTTDWLWCCLMINVLQQVESQVLETLELTLSFFWRSQVWPVRFVYVKTHFYPQKENSHVWSVGVFSRETASAPQPPWPRTFTSSSSSFLSFSLLSFYSSSPAALLLSSQHHLLLSPPSCYLYMLFILSCTSSLHRSGLFSFSCIKSTSSVLNSCVMWKCRCLSYC